MNAKELAVSKTFRTKPEKIYIGNSKLSQENPAFHSWALNLPSGSKLPRGKYFRTNGASLGWLIKN
ncbi:hypothetical protein WKH15_21685 [Pantoea agglomerans]|uniref:hypothetical protein n=1 Tax=Enterobacter agglomerans TaxID=549 RepID=UPI003C79A3CC